MIIRADLLQIQETAKTKIVRGKPQMREKITEKRGFHYEGEEDCNVTLPLFSLRLQEIEVGVFSISCLSKD